jgi:dipeptidyl aminopeptidase/acylaminoacyl peptidase
LRAVTVVTARGRVACELPSLQCAQQTSSTVTPDLIASPDGKRLVFRRGHDLWLRDGVSGHETRLTSDGVENFAYGDMDAYFDLTKVARRRAGIKQPLNGVLWSPDGRYVLALRQDLRPIPPRLLVTEYRPPDAAFSVQYEQRVAVAADAKRPDSSLTLIDTRQGKARKVTIDPQALNDWALPYFLSGVVWWEKAGDAVFLITANRGGGTYHLTRIDLTAGTAKDVLTETARSHNVRLNPLDYAQPNVQVSSNGQEAVWYSERDGWGHLYLVDLRNGAVKRQLTHGDWVVFDLLRVDETARTAYFTAGGREAGRNPYYRHLYRVGLDGGEPELLTPEDADHEFRNPFGQFKSAPGSSDGSRLSPGGRYFVDAYSKVDQAPKMVIRKVSGELVAPLLDADIAPLHALGWTAPEPITAKAADGTTALYGVLIKPAGFDPNKKYPVIEFTYPGPQGRWAPVAFAEGFFSNVGADPQAFAALGFVVVALDGRGTTGRSRAFEDAYLGTEDVFGAADHVAAIRDLARTHPFLDLDRIGVTGFSFGGYGSLRATLLNPDFFKVCVSGVGPAEWMNIQQPISVERFFGVPGDDEATRRFYDTISNTRLVDRLKGKLLLIYGGIDENVPLKNAFDLFYALARADRPYDLLMMPDSAHSAPREPYAVKRSMRYFLEHLANGSPPA